MRESDPYLSVIVPTYNEEERLPRTLASIVSYLESSGNAGEVIVVDDGSTDATLQVAESLSAADPLVRIIRNEHRGKAYAVRSGMLAAAGKYVLFTDADGATPITEADKLLSRLEAGYEVAIGSREGAEAQRIDEPWHRHLMGRVFNLIVRTLAVRGIHDTQCGFKAFQREAARDLFENMRLYGADTGLAKGALVTGFDVEILFMASKRGYRIAEVPVIWYYGAKSKVNPIKDSWRNLRDVLRVRWNDLRGQYRQGR